MRRMITKEYPYKTEEEKLTIYTFLNALYGHLYCSGGGNICIDRKAKIITTHLLLTEEQIQEEERITKEVEQDIKQGNI